MDDIGNNLTRFDCRGQGLAQKVTSAGELCVQQSDIQTIVLNVETTSIAVYEQKGAVPIRYFEGPAERNGES